MKKIFTLLVALVATTALWAEDFSVDGIYYNILADKTKEVEVTYCWGYNEYSGSVTIPETITYDGTTYSVTSIGDSAFHYCTSLTSITIPNSVTSIGKEAFSNCNNLVSVTIPNSVNSFGEAAFVSCTSLTSIAIPNSVTSIEKFTFIGCSSLISITIPNSVTSIGDWAFSECRSLTSVTIPNSVTSIGEGAFYWCSGLTSVTIPNSVTSIGEGTFRSCAALTSITIPNSVTSIGNSAFADCSGLTSVTIPNSVTSIGSGAFRSCSGLTSINVPKSVTNIGNEAFLGCSGLTFITIPNSVTSIGANAFSGCSGLTSITIPNSVTSIGEGAFRSCAALTSIVVEDGNMMYDSREKCNAIIDKSTNTLIAGCKNTIIPKSVTNIGNEAFLGCSSLTSITIPNSVTSIGNYAFWWCSALTSITIPNSVTSIGDYAFADCSSLSSINIPESVINVGPSAFSHSGIYNDDSNWENDELHIDNCLIAIKYQTKSGEYTIKNGIRLIAGGAFRGSHDITSIVIPNSVQSISESAFSGAYITSLVIPNSVKNIEKMAFSSCRYLSSVTLGTGITSIEEQLFIHCLALTTINIPENVKKIGANAFSNCEALESIYLFPATPPTLDTTTFYNASKPTCYITCGTLAEYQASDWNNYANSFVELCESKIFYTSLDGEIVVPYNSEAFGAKILDNSYEDGQGVITFQSTISRIGREAFHNCSSLSSIIIPNSVTEIERDAFSNCTALDTITIPNSVTYIGRYAFSNCTSLTSFDMSNNVEVIKEFTFYNCSALTEIVIPNSVKTIEYNAFDDCTRLGKVHIGASVETIYGEAFEGCNRLYDIYCYATYPPFVEESAFANYNVYLYVPCEKQRDYILDVVWGNFKFIECISSDNVETDGVVIIPTTNDVTIMWPTESNADTYTIVIKKGDEIFCTLTFNANGQLLNIAFAPSRDGNKRPAQYAEAVTNGYRFIVTGLEEDTDYLYNIDVKDTSNVTIKSYSGEFTTRAETAVEDIVTNDDSIQKTIRNGQLVIVRDGVEYNAQGQMIKE